MGKKALPIFMGIILCFALAVALFTFQACKQDQPTTDPLNSFGISASDFAPSWSPDGKKIVFTKNWDGNPEIFTMKVDGSNQTRLTYHPSADLLPSWSPDGTKIAFNSARDGNLEIYTMNSDGTNQFRLTENSIPEVYPSWSPDGNKIVFHSRKERNTAICIINADGSELKELTDYTNNDLDPSWSPDGSKIIFASNRDGNFEIYTMNTDGTNQLRLTESSASEAYPSWSPDGSRIVFVSERDGNTEIFTMKADGTEQTRLTYEQEEDLNPAWSPDGQKIVFTSRRDFDMEIYIMDPDGSNQKNLTNNAPMNAAFGMTPLPGSELNLEAIPYKIVYESFRETDGKENWEICMIDADGSNLINLTNTPEIDEMYPHASPDGHRICFTADEGENPESKSRNVYYMNIDGTNRVKIAENAYEPCWSGDGKSIAYLPGEFPRYNPSNLANKGIEIYSLETGDVKRHPNDKIIHINRLCWSPDGEWFVSAATGEIPGKKNAFKADDETMMRLSAIGCTPDISPDGKQIAWNSTDWNLNIGALDFNSPERSVTKHKIVVSCDRDHWVYHADWSPDENYLAFSYAPDGGVAGGGGKAPGCNICICDLRTGKWTLVTTDGKHNREPDWVPVQVH